MSLIVVNKSGGAKPPPGSQAAGPTPPMAVHAQPPTSIVGPPIVTTAINLSVSANLSAPYVPAGGKKPSLTHAHPNGALGPSYPVSAAPMVVSKKMIHGPVTTHLPINARPLPQAHQPRHLPAGAIVTSTSHGVQHLPQVAAAHLASPAAAAHGTATILTTSGNETQHLVQHHPPPVGHLTPMDPRLRMIQMPQHPALPQSPVRQSALSLTAHPAQSRGQPPRFTMPPSPIQLPQTPYNLNAHPLSQSQVAASHRLAPHAHRGAAAGKVVLSSNATASMLPKTPHPAAMYQPPHSTAMHTLPSSAVNLIPQAQLARTPMLPQPPSNLQPPPPSKILPPNLHHYQLFGGNNSRKRNNSEE